MGTIQTIERYGRSASRVTLNDGRELVLDGTNDVNDDNRGVLVEDERYGRIEIPWDEFRATELREPTGSGRGYTEYGEAKTLQGTVTTKDGESIQGPLVFDLDEQESWEVLNGSLNEVEFNIPFAMIASIEPQGRHGAEITLRNGETLELEDGQDVTDRNDGLALVVDGGERYLEWSTIRRIELH